MSDVVVVTGAGSGIGRAVAVDLLGAGYRVVLAGRTESGLAATARIGGGESLVVPTDVGDAGAVAALFAAVTERFGRIDALFNNAGVGAPGNVGDLDPADWDRVVRTNLTGAFLCAREAFNMMRAQRPRGGRIVNNGSVSAHSPRPGSVAYTATKHAITGLTKSISLDGRRCGIACGQIDIGNAVTAMTARMSEGVPQADGSIAAEPTMDVRHVAKAVRTMLELPLEANVPFLTITATAMPYLGRG